MVPHDRPQDVTIDATRITGFFVLDGILTREWDAAADAFIHLVLPAVTLASIPLAVIMRITRASVLEVTQEDFVRTAESKGLTNRVIRGRHIMRNAMLPVATTIGLLAGGLLSGAVLTETVFAFKRDRCVPCHRDRQPRLSGVDGLHPDDRDPVSTDQPDSRRLVHPHRSAGEGAMTLSVARRSASSGWASSPGAPDEQGTQPVGRGMRRVRRNPAALVGAAVLLLFVLIALIGPFFVRTTRPIRSASRTARCEAAPASSPARPPSTGWATTTRAATSSAGWWSAPGRRCGSASSPRCSASPSGR
jgi:hypothetical protein